MSNTVKACMEPCPRGPQQGPSTQLTSICKWCWTASNCSCHWRWLPELFVEAGATYNTHATRVVT